jgi:hypothetical protein
MIAAPDRRRAWRFPYLMIVEGFLLFGVLVFEIYRSLKVLPLPDGDQLAFYPVYLEVAHTGELRHAFYSPITDQFPAPMNWHGWLAPWLLGHVARLLGGDIVSVLQTEAIFIAAGLALFFAAQRTREEVPPLLIVLGGLIVAASLSAAKGRPELLAGFILLGWYVAQSHVHRDLPRCAITGIALGVLGSTQPTVAALFSLFVLAYATLHRHPVAEFARWLSANLLAAVIVAAGAELVFPNGLLFWLTGLAKHAAVVGTRPISLAGVPQYFLFAPERFMHGLVLLIAAFSVAAWLLKTRRISITSLATMAVCLFAAWYFGVRLPPTAYNLLVFVPLAVCLLLRLGVLQRLAAPAAAFPAANRLGARLVLTAAALSLPMQMAVTGFNDRYGVSRDEFQAMIDRISSNRSRIVIDPSLLVGAVPFEKWPSMRPWRPQGLVAQDAGPICGPQDVVIVKQANSGQTAPPRIQGCRLSADTFTPIRVRFFGKDLVLIPKAYQYALFQEDGAR